MAMVHEAKNRDIVIHGVGCNMGGWPRVFLRGISFATCGLYCSLGNAPELGTLILTLSKEELELKQLRSKIDKMCVDVYQVILLSFAINFLTQ